MNKKSIRTGFLILLMESFLDSLELAKSSSLEGSNQASRPPINKHEIENNRPIVCDMLIATTLIEIIMIFEKISTSAHDLILSFFGVNSLRKYPQEDTAKPAERAAVTNPTSHKDEGEKKKGSVATMQTTIP